MFTRIIVKLYKSIGDGVWDSTPTYLDVYDVDCNVSIGDKNDTFSFKIDNVRDSFIKVDTPFRQSIIRSQDQVQIHYLINSDSVQESNLIFNGLVKKVEEEVSGNKKVLRVSGSSFSEIATQALTFVTGNEGSNVNVMQFISAAVNSITYFSTAFKLTLDVPSQKYNPVNDTYTGGSFPLLNNGYAVREFNVSLSTLLDRYLQNEYTGDGRYYWYVTQDKKLRVRKRNVGGISSDLREGVDFYNLKFSINSDDVKNFIIIKCGLDSYNKPITARYDDVVSRAKYGFRYYMLVENTISGNLLAAQGFASDKKFPSSYPYTTTWGAVTNSDSSFNNALRLKAQSEGVLRGESFASARSKGFLKVSGSIPPTLRFGVSDRVRLTSGSYALSNYPMRITSIRYDVDGVDLVLEEEVAVA